MAEKDDTPSAAEGTETRRRRRPPVTIDLTAEAAATAPPTESEVAAETEAFAAETIAANERAPDDGDSPLKRWLPIGAAAIVGGIVGGVIAGFLFAPQTDTISAASNDSRFATIASRLDALEAKSSASGGEPAVDPARLAAIEAGLARLEAAPAPTSGGTATAAAIDLQPLEERIAALEQRPAPAPADFAPVEQKLAALDSRIGTIETHPPSDPATEAAARTIALTSLRQAALGGQHFGAELEAFKTLGGDSAPLATLEPLADAGAPSTAALQAAFPAVAADIRAAALRVDPDAGILSRLAASAGALVEVKPAGPVQGTSATAIVSRMEADVAKGDFQAALTESDGLDPGAKAPLADWADGARRRLAIDAALAALAGAR